MGPTVYRASRLLPGGPQWTAIEDGAVLVENGRITVAAQWARIHPDLPPGAAVLDLGDVTLMPGLVDAHVHLGFDGGADPAGRMQASDDLDLLVVMLRSARELLSVGVTTTRDMGARNYLDVRVRDAVRAGEVPGPRVVTAGPPLTPTGGHCWFMGGEADGETRIRQRVREHRKRGADALKIMATGGYMTPGFGPRQSQFSDAEIHAAVEEAHRLGLRVAAHTHGVAGIAQALDAGVDSLEHCSFLHPDGRVAWDDELGSRIAASGVHVAPTAHFRNRAVTESRDGAFVPLVGELHRAGASVIASTDAGVNGVPHRAFVGALEVMNWLGMPLSDVLSSATWRAAEALGLGRTTGTIAPGLAADLIAVDGDPRDDLSSLDRVRLVVADGRRFVPDELPSWRSIPL